MKKIAAVLTVILLLSITAFASPVQGLTLSLSQESTEPGVPVDMVLSVSGNPGLAACYVQISYDTQVLELVSVDGARIFGNFLSEKKQDGIVLSWEGELTGNGTLAILTFRPLKASVTAEVTVQKYLNGFLDGTAAEVTASYENGSVTVSAAAAGDLTGNGAIDADDVTALARHLAFLSALPEGADGDLNHDGRCNTADLTLLAKQVANI